MRHGAKKKRCSSEGCKNEAKRGGVCIRHGAKRYVCSSEGCTNGVVKGGVCVKHGAKVKLCSSDGCTNNALKGGVCQRHGAYRNSQDESTAFGSEFETTSPKPLTKQLVSGAVPKGSERRSVPEEVTIICQQIVKV